MPRRGKSDFVRSLKNAELGIECTDTDRFFKMGSTHYHDFYEIYFQVYGDRYLLDNGKFIHVRPGNLVWINKFEPHQSFPGEIPLGNRVVLYFTENFLRRVFKEEADRLLALFSGIFQIVSLDARQQRKELDLLYEIEDAIRTQQPLYAQFVFGQLLLLLEHWMNTQAVRLSGAEVPDAKHSRISQVLSYLKNHCNERIRLDEVAEVFHITPPYLSRTFKQCTGISFVNYVNHLKIEQAKEMLAGPETITRISMELGYDSVTHFERIFKQVTGVSPTAWKKRQGG